jgi:hypothetical protein
VETVRKFGYGDAQCEAISDVPQRKAVPSAASRSSPIQLGRIKIPEGVTMSNLAGLAAIVSELRKERANQANELKHLDAALAVLGKLGGGSSSTKSGHAMSAAGRRRISLAQKARWARARSHNVVPISAKRGKHTISAAGRRRIAAAARARWAKFRAAKK